MMKCEFCNSPARDAARYCRDCGASLGDAKRASAIKAASPIKASNTSSASLAGKSPSFWISILGFGAILAILAGGLMSNDSGGNGGSQAPTSAFYDAGYNFGRNNIGRNTDRQSAYNQCNGMANTVKFNNPSATNSELTDWVRGCMAYVAN